MKKSRKRKIKKVLLRLQLEIMMEFLYHAALHIGGSLDRMSASIQEALPEAKAEETREIVKCPHCDTDEYLCTFEDGPEGLEFMALASPVVAGEEAKWKFPAAEVLKSWRESLKTVSTTRTNKQGVPHIRCNKCCSEWFEGRIKISVPAPAKECVQCPQCGADYELTTVERIKNTVFRGGLVCPVVVGQALQWNGIKNAISGPVRDPNDSKIRCNSNGHPRLHCEVCGKEWYERRVTLPE